MKLRVAVVACAAVASLALAGSALAAFSPKLAVSSVGGSTRVGVVVGSSDDPTAQVAIYVPAAYRIGTPAPGTKLGNVTATAAAGDFNGIVLPLTGELDAIAPTSATTAVAAACSVSPSQTWVLHVTAQGQPLDIPLFVVAGSPAEIAAGYSAKLVVCLPPPDVPAGTPGRSAFGAKLLSATFTSSALAEPAAGDLRWTSLWTPYTPRKGTANPAGTVEVQSLRHLPVRLRTTVTRKKLTSYKTRRIKGKKQRVKIVRTLVRFSSHVTENGAPASSAAITTRAGGKKVGGASGSFVLARGKSATVTATAVVDSDAESIPTGQPPAPGDLFYHDLGASGCVASAIFQGLPCRDATVGGESVRSVTHVTSYR
jgi:hypothetical protein